MSEMLWYHMYIIFIYKSVGLFWQGDSGPPGEVGPVGMGGEKVR